jgi:hypothetical protein
MRQRVAFVLAVIGLAVMLASGAGANTELVPGTRVVFPFFDISTGNSTFLLLHSTYAGVATVQLAVGRASRLQAVLDDLSTRPASGRWDPLALRILHTRFQAQLRALVSKCQAEARGGGVEVVESDLAQGRLREVRRQVDDVLGSEKVPSVATLMVLEERVSAAVTRL